MTVNSHVKRNTPLIIPQYKKAQYIERSYTKGNNVRKWDLPSKLAIKQILSMTSCLNNIK